MSESVRFSELEQRPVTDHADSARPPAVPRIEGIRSAVATTVAHPFMDPKAVAAAAAQYFQTFQEIANAATDMSLRWLNFGALNPIDFARNWSGHAKIIQDSAIDSWIATCRPIMEQYTRLQVMAWLEKDARVHTADDGTSAGGRYYLHMKNQMQSWLGLFPPPIRFFVTDQLKSNPELQARMRDALMARQFRLIDAIIRERYPDDHGRLFKEEYNHKILTETRPEAGKRDGTIVAVGPDKVVDLFKRHIPSASTMGNDYPHIVISFSHAQGETRKDVKRITHGIEVQATHAQGEKLNLGYLQDGEEINRGHTVVLYACDVEETPWLNGAALLERINELKRIEATGEPDREFKFVSPGAKRVAKLMLKCMVEDPTTIDVDDEKSLAEIMSYSDAPMRLREDAVHIANHFQLVGYSKGGNTATDAMRYLIHELTAERANGKKLFAKHDGTEISERRIRSIVRSIATMALASVEVKLSDFDKKHGLRRLSVNNREDLISAHNYFEDAADDERWMIEGIDQHMGHAPEDYFGRRGRKNEPADGFGFIPGYAARDERVKRRLQEFYAPHYNRAAITTLHFGSAANDARADNVVYFETSPGTTDAQLVERDSEEKPSRIDVMKYAFQQAGLHGVKITRDDDNPGFFKLSANGVHFTQRAGLEKLQKGFQTLRTDINNRLVIAQTIIERDIGERLKGLGPSREVA